jgi:hypothetical protein
MDTAIRLRESDCPCRGPTLNVGGRRAAFGDRWWAGPGAAARPEPFPFVSGTSILNRWTSVRPMVSRYRSSYSLVAPREL